MMVVCGIITFLFIYALWNYFAKIYGILRKIKKTRIKINKAKTTFTDGSPPTPPSRVPRRQ
jgi:hypothetical protein